MRRWIADRCRLALRKVLPKLIAFALVPTRQEMERVFAQIWGGQAVITPNAAAEPPRPGTTLH